MSTIYVIKGQSQYDVLRIAADEIAEGFRAYSEHKVEVIDVNENFSIADVQKMLAMKPYMIFSLQALFFDMVTEKGNLLSSDSTATIGWIVDHPVYHGERVTNTRGENMHILTIDQTHTAYINDYLLQSQSSSYLPHGGFKANKLYTWSQKDIEVLMPGGYQNPNLSYDQLASHVSGVFKDVADDIIFQIKKNPQLDYQLALKRYLDSVNFDYSKDEYVEIVREIIPYVDRYLRHYVRHVAVKALIDHHIHVTVVGNGWDEFEACDSPYFHQYKRSASIQEVVDLIARSKLVLNVSAIYPKGSHERVFTAMLSKTVCLSNRSDYFESRFDHQKHIMYYNPLDERSIVESARAILDDSELASSVTDEAYAVAISNDTWAHRAKDILGKASEIHQNLTNKRRVSVDKWTLTPKLHALREGSLAYTFEEQMTFVKHVNVLVYQNETPTHLTEPIFDISSRSINDQAWGIWLSDIEETIRIREQLPNAIDRDFMKVMDFVSVTTVEDIFMSMIKHIIDLRERDEAQYERIVYQYQFSAEMFGEIDLDQEKYHLFEERSLVLKERQEDFFWLYDHLSDYRSKNVLVTIIKNWLELDISGLIKIKEEVFDQYFDHDIIGCDKDEVFVDCGAFDGDTIENFIDNFGSYKKIIGYEVTGESFEKCCQRLKPYQDVDMRRKGLSDAPDKMKVEKLGLDGTRNTLASSTNGEGVDIVRLDDDICQPISFIKMDIEGFEQRALEGARRHIEENKPKLAISVYHGNRDLIEIPKLIKSIREDYQFYLRYYGNQYAPVEVILYAV